MGDDAPIRVYLRPVGNALPLGFFSFGLGMFLLGALGVGLVSGEDSERMGLLLAAFVFPLELLAAVVAFLARDTLGATALGLFAASWLTVGLAMLTIEGGSRSRSLGLYLLFFAAIVAALAVVAAPVKPLIAVILVVAAARATFGGAFELTGARWLEYAGGGCAFLLAGLGLYGGLAFALEDAGRPVLPVLRRAEAEASVEQSIEEQLERVGAEPGVRRQF